MMRNVIDSLFGLFSSLAAFFLFVTLSIIILNILGRQFGFFLPGADAYAGYAIAAVAFFALAGTLKRNEHIRVTLLLQRLGIKGERRLQIWAHTVGVLVAAYFSFYSWRMVWFSHRFGDVSHGQDATPLWIPQMVMALGVSVFTLALLDSFREVLSGRAAKKLQEPARQE
jgi:TRAP-type C4-dicarboxylate transport system permease small subunit